MKKPKMSEFIDKNDWKTFLATSMFIEKGESVLDVGAGNGKVIKLLEKFHGCNISAVDVQNQSNIPIKNYKLFDGENLPYKDNAVDTILLSYVFHHVDKNNKHDFLKECMRVTKKKIIMNEDVPKNAFDRLLSKLHGWEFKKRTGIESEPSFLNFEGFKKLFAKLNLNLKHVIKFPRFAREFYYPINRLMFVLELKT